ncbi:glycosyltransferase [Corynebacterium sp. TAE3-ERU12]|nr:glycosyltransferase [Corynebacterium sp. TAE3-ERU12]
MVTKDRLEDVTESLGCILDQNRKPQWLIVVDNGNDDRVRAVCDNLDGHNGVEVIYLGSKTNLGGAGGFALGMLHGLALGADWIWCGDDDGRPEGPDVLRRLLVTAERHELDVVSPLVCDIDDGAKLAFPLRRGLRWRRERSEVIGEDNPNLPSVYDDEGNRYYVNFAVHHAATGEELPEGLDLTDPEGDLLPGIVNLFNGALISAKALARTGVPDYRLFIRGDEVEFSRRLKRSKLRYGTCLTTAYLHPAGSDEFKMIVSGVHAQYPDSDFKRYYTYRNRGYVMSQPGMLRLLPQEYIRFTAFFLFKRKDPIGLVRWWALHRKGRREHFDPYVPPEQRQSRFSRKKKSD